MSAADLKQAIRTVLELVEDEQALLRVLRVLTTATGATGKSHKKPIPEELLEALRDAVAASSQAAVGREAGVNQSVIGRALSEKNAHPRRECPGQC